MQSAKAALSTALWIILKGVYLNRANVKREKKQITRLFRKSAEISNIVI